MSNPQTRVARVEADGVDVFYREAGAENLPVVLLLHGFPSSSFQYRHLIHSLAHTGKYRVIAPDLPGFGFTVVPESRKYPYTFEGFKTTVLAFLDALKITKFAVYIFDYGAPTALRIALERPHAIAGIISQNGNAYVEGFGKDFWAPIEKLWKEDTKENRDALLFATNFETTKFQYEHGAPDPSKLEPETWHLDYSLMQRPGNANIQIGFFKDYGTNVPLYPKFQEYLRKYQPPLIAIWGKNDIIFIPAGAEKFKDDLPNATVEILDGGHFLLESHLEVMAPKIINFLETKVKF